MLTLGGRSRPRAGLGPVSIGDQREADESDEHAVELIEAGEDAPEALSLRNSGKHEPMIRCSERLSGPSARPDTGQLRLTHDRQRVLGNDHRFALSGPTLVSETTKKSFLQCQLADLGVQRLQIDRRLGTRGRATEHVGGSFE